MFTNTEFLSTLGVGLGIGLATAIWLTRSLAAGLRELHLPKLLVKFWTAFIQVCSVMLPTAASLFILATNMRWYPEVVGTSVVCAGCAGSLMAALIAAAVVVWASSETSSTVLTSADHNELRQLLYRMRDFRAREIVRSSELAEKTD